MATKLECNTPNVAWRKSCRVSETLLRWGHQILLIPRISISRERDKIKKKSMSPLGFRIIGNTYIPNYIITPNSNFETSKPLKTQSLKMATALHKMRNYKSYPVSKAESLRSLQNRQDKVYTCPFISPKRRRSRAKDGKKTNRRWANVLDAPTQNGDEPVGEYSYPGVKLPF